MHDVERLVDLYDTRAIGRRELLAGLVALGLGSPIGSSARAPFHGRTLNHVTLGVSNVARSKAFYQRMFDFPIRDEAADFCEFRMENAFLGLYKDSALRIGLDHFAIGVDGYDARAAFNTLKREFPDASATIENDDQVYFRDPDGAKGQLTALAYKR